MKYALLVLFSLLSCALPTRAQTSNGIPVIPVLVAPAGACPANGLRYLIPDGLLYGCDNGSWAVIGGSPTSGTVTSVGFTGGIISVGTPTTTPAFTVAGTSGGVPCFTSTSTWASSVLLTANMFIIGGGAGVCPSPLNPAYSALTDGATVTWAIGSSLLSKRTLLFTTNGGSRTLNITGAVSGGSYVLRVTQDASGVGEGLILGSGCTWKVSNGGAGAITPSIAANAVDVLAFEFDGTNCLANFNKNFN